MQEKIKKFAEKYYNDGLSIIPLHNGSKHPTITWGESQNRIVRYNFDNATGISLVAGKVSGQGAFLEIIDFDLKNEFEPKSLWDKWKQSVSAINKGLLRKLLVERTPNGGFHVAYRTSVWAPSQHLAMRHGNEAEKKSAYERSLEKKKDEAIAKRDANNYHRILIETLSTKHPVTIYPTEGYELLTFDWLSVPEITPDERALLLDAARELNEFYPEPDPIYEDKSLSGAFLESPYEAYNRSDAFLQILEAEGWIRKGRSSGQYIRYVAPESKTGIPNCSYRSDNNRFYVFTPNTALPDNKPISPVDVYLIFKANGDKKTAYNMLLDEGYGKRAEKVNGSMVKTGHTRQDPPKHANTLPEKANSKVDFMDWTPRYSKDDLTWIARRDSYTPYLDSIRNGTMQKGLKTFMDLDKFFRFKKGLFVPINGHDNVGKTVAWIYILLIAVLYHKWKIGLITNENSTGGIARKILEFYYGKKYEDFTTEEQDAGTKWLDENFYIVDVEGGMTHYDVMDMGKVMVEEFGIDALLVDPYNSLDVDETKLIKLNTHEYHYKILGYWRRWAKKYNCTLYVCCHAVTTATRLKSKDGRPVAPNKADTEQGSKFAARADDFITIHRDVSGVNFRDTEIHVRKVKETETGGRPTQSAEPFMMRMEDGCKFIWGNNRDVIAEWREKNKPKPLPAPIQIKKSFSESLKAFSEPVEKEEEQPFFGEVNGSEPF